VSAVVNLLLVVVGSADCGHQVTNGATDIQKLLRCGIRHRHSFDGRVAELYFETVILKI
jgi:hypothetical protein